MHSLDMFALSNFDLLRHLLPAMAPPLRLEPEDELSLLLFEETTVTVVCRACRTRVIASGRVLVGGGIFGRCSVLIDSFYFVPSDRRTPDGEAK